MPSAIAFLSISMVALLTAAAFLGWTARRGRRALEAEGAVPRPRVEASPAVLQMLSRATSDLLFVLETDGTVLWASPSAERAFGVAQDRIVGQPFTTRMGELDRYAALELLRRAVAEGSSRGTLHAIVKGDDVRQYDAVLGASSFEGRTVVAVAGRDVTEQVRLQEKLLHAQKLDAVGRLATGVAHDFNNLLSVVQAGTALARESLPPGHPAHADLADVAAAAGRGQALTRQLLAFSRKAPDAPARADVGPVLAEMARFVPRILPAGIQVRIVEEEGLGSVPVASGSLEQVVLNLAINARDAMPRGGWIRVEGRRVEVRPGDAGRLSPGPYVEIAVHDQGTGMTEEVRRHIFEPFFTTKEVGKGSGLGLATSLEIVEAAGGRIEVESEVGRGSVFRVLLPRLPVGAAAPASRIVVQPPPARRTRVILAGHDPALVALVSRLLATRGHDVLTAASAMEARQQAASYPGEIDVVVTGLELGRDSGVAVLGEVRRTSPRARAVLVSGDAAAGDVEHLLEAGVELVRRPVQPEALVEVVERAASRSPARRQSAMA